MKPIHHSGLTCDDLAAQIGATVTGDATTRITHIAPLYRAGAGSLTFISHARYLPALPSCGAAAVILKPDWLPHCPSSCVALAAKNPYLGYARATALLHPEDPQDGDEKALISPRATLGQGTRIAAAASIAHGARIGDRVMIGAGCRIGKNAVIGDNTLLRANVVVEQDCQIGKNCRIQAGAVIGADGFGYAPDNDRWVRIPQIGRVLIGDRVEIGANTTIDRGALDDTVIGNGAILDNQIQIAHNVIIGENTAIAGCVGIAGSATIGKRCTIGGAATILGHLTIVDDVQINAMSLVTSSITTPGNYASATPLDKTVVWRRNFARFRRLDEMAKRITTLERIISLENNN